MALIMARGAPRLRSGERMNLAGERVRQRRDELKLTRADLAGRLADNTDAVWNPAFPEIRRIETGQRIISDLELLALGQTLNCKPEWLLTGEDGYAPKGSKRPLLRLKQNIVL